MLIGGPPASGKTTLAAALAPALGAAPLDLDAATGPLTALVLELIGARDLSEHEAAALTRDRRYATLLALAGDIARAGLPTVLTAPFTRERTPAGWAAATAELAQDAEPRLVWLTVPAAESVRRLESRAAARDTGKRADPAAWLASLPIDPPSVEHLALDGTVSVGALVEAVRADLAERTEA